MIFAAPLPWVNDEDLEGDETSNVNKYSSQDTKVKSEYLSGD